MVHTHTHTHTPTIPKSFVDLSQGCCLWSAGSPFFHPALWHAMTASPQLQRWCWRTLWSKQNTRYSHVLTRYLKRNLLAAVRRIVEKRPTLPATGQRANGTTGQTDGAKRDNGTTGQRDNGPTGQRANGTDRRSQTGQRDDGTTGQRANGTDRQSQRGQRDNGTTGHGPTGQTDAARPNGTRGQLDNGTKGQWSTGRRANGTEGPKGTMGKRDRGAKRYKGQTGQQDNGTEGDGANCLSACLSIAACLSIYYLISCLS